MIKINYYEIEFDISEWHLFEIKIYYYEIEFDISEWQLFETVNNLKYSWDPPLMLTAPN